MFAAWPKLTSFMVFIILDIALIAVDPSYLTLTWMSLFKICVLSWVSDRITDRLVMNRVSPKVKEFRCTNRKHHV